MKKEDFVFAVGSFDNVVIVDKSLRNQYQKLNSRSLTDLGLYKAAFCSAYYDQQMGVEGAEDDLNYLLESLNRHQASHYSSISTLNRLFGVFSIPHDAKIKAL